MVAAHRHMGGTHSGTPPARPCAWLTRREWSAPQERILRLYGQLRGKSSELARLLYLQLVRQWRVYGSTFFLSSPEPPPNGPTGASTGRGARRVLMVAHALFL
jgi:hypothetical protein